MAQLHFELNNKFKFLIPIYGIININNITLYLNILIIFLKLFNKFKKAYIDIL